jgi:hypothetical protein
MSRFIIEEVNPNDILYIEKNARYMSREEFSQLVRNIKRDGQLSSTPFCTKEDGKLTVISGNHRVKAAVEAGLTKIHTFTAENLTNDEIRAIQLSHNSIAGKDDLTILKELFEEIQNSEYKNYAFIDNSLFDEMEKMSIEIVQPVNEFISISLMFFDAEFSKFEDILQEVKVLDSTSEVIIPLPMQDYTKFTDVISMIKEEYGIKDYGATLIKMASIVEGLLGKQN